MRVLPEELAVHLGSLREMQGVTRSIKFSDMTSRISDRATLQAVMEMNPYEPRKLNGSADGLTWSGRSKSLEGKENNCQVSGSFPG